MIITSVTQVGNPIIRRKSIKITSVKSPKIKKIIKDLTDTMRDANLVGISAPQIGQNIKIFITEIRNTTFRKTNELSPLKVFINPYIIERSKKIVSAYEGCGSVGASHIFAKVPRSYEVTVSALDEKGEKYIFTAKGLLARVIQHEHDHLEGIVFLDRVTDMKSLMSKEEYLKKFGKKNKR